MSPMWRILAKQRKGIKASKAKKAKQSKPKQGKANLSKPNRTKGEESEAKERGRGGTAGWDLEGMASFTMAKWIRSLGVPCSYLRVFYG